NGVRAVSIAAKTSADCRSILRRNTYSSDPIATMTAMISIGIVGGTGYTGVELLRLLAQHPQADVRAITSRKDAGTRVTQMFPSLRGRCDLVFCEPQAARLAECKVVFFATPHGVAMSQARELLAAGVRIIDLAADFRLADPALFE